MRKCKGSPAKCASCRPTWLHCLASWAVPHEDLRAALDSVGLGRYYHSWVNRLVPRFSADQLIDMLAAAGCALLGQYGIWSVCPYLLNEHKWEPEYFANLEQLEHALSGVYPYYLLARLFQLIVQRND